ncbi:hypothetical protein FQR65_LT07401 [Abscondita terminalis]|nr:hypothetical protein FQR65_LT07401 [Abscondita terminalis]
MFSTNFKLILTTLVVLIVHSTTNGDIVLSPKEVLIKVGNREVIVVEVTNFNRTNVTLNFVVENNDIFEVIPSQIKLVPGDQKHELVLHALDAGHSELFTESTDPDLKVNHLYLVANVLKNEVIDIVSQISGWIYFVTWGLSYYPQIYINFKRKSVVGLSFDFLALNIVGYISFGIFIQNLYFAPAMQDEYFEKNSRGLIPVKVNDVVYNLHGIFAVLFTIFQCFIYERGTQVISIPTRVILGLIGIFYVVLFILRGVSVIQWLDFLYYSSYVKLLITVLKYIPQAFMNYKRKSTLGWSIGVVLLNLIGGICSLGQMIFDSYNYDDWLSIFGNPTKFGLGLFTVLFQIVFIVQHYVLYKNDFSNTKF